MYSTNNLGNVSSFTVATSKCFSTKAGNITYFRKLLFSRVKLLANSESLGRKLLKAEFPSNLDSSGQNILVMRQLESCSLIGICMWVIWSQTVIISEGVSFPSSYQELFLSVVSSSGTAVSLQSVQGQYFMTFHFGGASLFMGFKEQTTLSKNRSTSRSFLIIIQGPPHNGDVISFHFLFK